MLHFRPLLEKVARSAPKQLRPFNAYTWRGLQILAQRQFFTNRSKHLMVAAPHDHSIPRWHKVNTKRKPPAKIHSAMLFIGTSSYTLYIQEQGTVIGLISFWYLISDTRDNQWPTFIFIHQGIDDWLPLGSFFALRQQLFNMINFAGFLPRSLR